MKRVGGPSVPVVGGAVQRGPPPGPPRPAPDPPAKAAASPWSVSGPAARPQRRHSRWPGLLLMLAGAGGLVALSLALRDGMAMSWSKAASIDIAAWVAARPGWAPGVAADLAVLTRPTLLWVVAGIAAIGAIARRGFAVGLLLMAFAAAFAAQGPGVLGVVPDWLPMARAPSAPVFWVVMVWAWLFTVLGGGLMPVLGVAAAAAAALGRVAVGDDAPVDALIGGCAALVVWGAINWLVPRRRQPGAG